MSYSIELIDPITKETLEIDEPHMMRGGTYAIGGTTCLELNVTYNYGNHFRMAFNNEEGIRIIYGMTGAESIPILEAAAKKLKNDVSEDYWEPTEGNAKRAILQLRSMAIMRPDGIWEGD